MQTWLDGLPDPGQASTLDEIAEQLLQLKQWAGAPSYETITRRVNEARPPGERVGRSTVVDCFRPGRRRLDHDLVTSVVGALHPDPGYVNHWRQALKVRTGASKAPDHVRVLHGLPGVSGGFVGRQDIIAHVRHLAGDPASPSRHPRRTPLVFTVQGMAGAGKTQLAVHLAHLLLTDGVLDEAAYVDLRGFHESQPPADPDAVLDSLLRLLGVPGQQIPVRTADRQALYQERVAGRRMLILLDNAGGQQQVTPLLPQEPQCLVLITSRRVLAVPQAEPVQLDPFTPPESRLYITDALGRTATSEDARAVDRIAERCGHLPLALALATGQMRARSGWTPTDHADWLDERRETGQFESGVALALEVSYRSLPPGSRRVLRALTLHPGQSFDTAAAAALADLDVQTMTGLLEDLAAQHLIRQESPGRYTFHDLIREFVAALAVNEDRRVDRRQALNRLLDHYLTRTVRETERVEQASSSAASPERPSSEGRPEDSEAPGAWLDLELSNLVATAQMPLSSHDRQGYAGGLSAALHRYLGMRGLDKIALSVHEQAVRVAREAGDLHGEADAVMQLAMTEMRRSAFPEALAHLKVAGDLYERCDDETGLLSVLSYRAVAEARTGQARAARRNLLAVLAIRRRTGDGPETIRTLQNLAGAEFGMGLYQQAAKNLEEAMTLARRHGDAWLEAVSLCNLGGTEVKLGRLAEAEAHLLEALENARTLAFRTTEGVAQLNLGDVYKEQGDYRRAETFFRESLEVLKEGNHRSAQLAAYVGLGDVALAQGNPEAAVREYLVAHDGARNEGVVDVERLALIEAGLGEAYQRLGDSQLAYEHKQQAHRLWLKINKTEAARSARELSTRRPGAAEDPPG
ncbi:tetratricopeptide repeat protein [Kineosporia sp. J2-2]|uniref:Tetratricopeptide repeat protein n=1 Tax=Kineosporia corallincola TaxID=2835133 RepID=A0ABS5TFH2_9ACTN|nr:tetratricopeptide repeat protein [Kineosporia corallincola]MBT0769834.1 tetratricopeptide repeat protein [Kineosporia corallincola]